MQKYDVFPFFHGFVAAWWDERNHQYHTRLVDRATRRAFGVGYSVKENK